MSPEEKAKLKEAMDLVYGKNIKVDVKPKSQKPDISNDLETESPSKDEIKEESNEEEYIHFKLPDVKSMFKRKKKAQSKEESIAAREELPVKHRAQAAESPQLKESEDNQKETNQENNIPKENHEPNELITDASPHIKDKADTKKIMWNVVIALMPAVIAAIYFFKIRSLTIILASVIAALATEFIIKKLTKSKITIKDGSAVITGILLALILPPTVPVWIPILGSIFAISIAKMAFGGLGHNIFNPALAGRAFLVASWPTLMTRWITPDGITTATPLGLLKQGVAISASYSDMFFGNLAGSLGETSAIALLIGAAWLFYKKIIDWKIPATYLGTVIIMSAIFKQDILLHLLTGGLLIGAFFMATDYVTSPVTKTGKLWFGFGCGFLTMILRLFSGYPEGVMFSILLMNTATPIIERFTKPKPFGFRSKKQVKEQTQEEKEIKKKVDEMLK